MNKETLKELELLFNSLSSKQLELILEHIEKGTLDFNSCSKCIFDILFGNSKYKSARDFCKSIGLQDHANRVWACQLDEDLNHIYSVKGSNYLYSKILNILTNEFLIEVKKKEIENLEKGIKELQYKINNTRGWVKISNGSCTYYGFLKQVNGNVYSFKDLVGFVPQINKLIVQQNYMLTAYNFKIEKSDEATFNLKEKQIQNYFDLVNNF